MRIVFWNVNRKDLSSHVSSLAKATGADVIVLVENSIPSSETLKVLCQDVIEDFFVPPFISDKRFQCFSRNHSLCLGEVHAGRRVSVRKVIFSRQTVLLALIHGVDMRNYDAEARQSAVQLLADDLRLVKGIHNTNRMIVMGDFNMNPFDRGMNLAAGMNAMPTRACVSAGSRREQGRDYDLFYNPMWSLLGDLSVGPPGTIFNRSSIGHYGWSMLDQVILSHSVLDLFVSVEIISTAGGHSLLDARGRPASKQYSDHLPLMLELREF